jgi:hypothetical protein
MRDDLESLVNELGIEVVTPAAFRREKDRLEHEFLLKHGIEPADIEAAVRSCELHHDDLVQQWIDLFSLEEYVFPRTTKRRPPDKRVASRDDRRSRESGSFLFRATTRMKATMIRLYSSRWVRRMLSRWAGPKRSSTSRCRA